MAKTPSRADKHEDLAKKKALEALLEKTRGSVEEKVAALKTVRILLTGGGSARPCQG